MTKQGHEERIKEISKGEETRKAEMCRWRKEKKRVNKERR